MGYDERKWNETLYDHKNKTTNSNNKYIHITHIHIHIIYLYLCNMRCASLGSAFDSIKEITCKIQQQYCHISIYMYYFCIYAYSQCVTFVMLYTVHTANKIYEQT